jgi:membrane protein DedA with SNARE-associated domain
MRPTAIKAWLIGALVVAGALSVVGQKTSSPAVGWVSFACFLGAVFLYAQWRRSLHNVRRADETRARPDQ